MTPLSRQRSRVPKLISYTLLLALLASLLPFRPAFAATLTVTTTTDEITTNGQCSLREALTNANNGAQTFTDCAAGEAGSDTLVLPAGDYTLTLGALTVTSTVTISGAGSGTTGTNLFGNGTARLLIVENSGTLTLRNLSIEGGRGGDAPAGYGGGLLNRGNTTIQLVRFEDNTADFGGAIFNCTNNPTPAVGCIATSSTMLIEQSFFTNNRVSTRGGAIFQYGGTLTLRTSLFTSNSTATVAAVVGANDDGADHGGAIRQFRGVVNIFNSTFVSNTAGLVGGAIAVSHDGVGATLLVNASTFTDNTAGTNGGAIAHQAGTVTLRQSILSDNTATAGPNCSGTIDTVNGYNLIRDATGCAITAANNIIGSDPQLGLLQNNGGPTQTRAPLGGSPAINAVPLVNCVAAPNDVDQRGVSRPQPIAGTCDIGAVEISTDVTPPTATSTPPDVVAPPGGVSYTFTVTYTDNAAIRTSSVISNNAAIQVSGPGAFLTLATNTAIDNTANGTPRVATYQITPPGGTWDAADTGTYTVALLAGQISDTSLNTAAAATLGTFVVDVVTPDTTILSGPSSPTNTTSATFTFTGTDNLTPLAGLTFECRVDGGPFTACTSPDLRIVGAGSHTFEVRARDALGNLDPTPATFVWVVDQTPPTVDLTGPTGVISTTSATLNFTITDALTTTAVCRLDSNPLIDPCASPQSFSGLAEGAHTFVVTATDAATNLSSATRTWTVDTIPPNASLTAPSPVLLPGDGFYTFTVTLNDAIAVAVASLDSADMRVTGPGGFNQLAQFVSVTPSGDGSPRTATYRLLVPGAAWDEAENGTYTVKLQANQIFDTVGNAVPAADLGTFLVAIDVTPPLVSITGGPPSVTNIPTATLTFTGTDALNPPVSFECRVDGGGWSLCTSPFTTTVLADGLHTFEVRGSDARSNLSVPVTRTWTIDTVAPLVLITSGPSSPTNTTTANFSFTVTEGGSGINSVTCSLDGGAFVACDTSSSQSYAGLSAGSHTLVVRALDNAGNQGTSATYSWIVDLTAPTPTLLVANLTAELPAAHTFIVTYTDNLTVALASIVTGNIRVTGPGGYNQIATLVTRTPATDSSQIAATYSITVPDGTWGQNDNGTYTVTLLANQVRDTATNPAVAADLGTFTVLIDTTPPTVTLLSGPSGLISATVSTFTFTGTDDLSLPISFECQIDGGGFSACVSPFNTPVLADGSHTFEVRALDARSNTSQPVTRTWTIDATAPDTTLLTGPSGIISATNATFTFTGTDALSGVAGFECSLDGATFTDCSSGTISYSGLSEGSRSFAVRAVDVAGNRDATPATRIWIVDVSDPTTSITLAPPPISNTATATFVFTGTDAGSGVAGFECSLDGGAFTSCNSGTISYSGLSEGNHTFAVRAVDNASNRDTTPATAAWFVDTLAPGTSITTTPSDPSPTGVTFVFTGTDTGSGLAGFECSLDGAAFVDCSSGTVSYSGLSGGAHTFAVRAFDSASNRDASPATFGWTVDATLPGALATAPSILIPGGVTQMVTVTYTDNSAINAATISSGDVRITGPGGYDQPGTLIDLTPATNAAQIVARYQIPASGGTWDESDNGTYTVTMLLGAVADTVGNNVPSGVIGSFLVQIDTIPPVASILSGPSGAINIAGVTFTFTGTDNLSLPQNLAFSCRVNGAPFSDCSTGSFAFTAPADGNYTFEVFATDEYANAGAPVSRTWVLDRVLPTTTITTGPLSPTNSTLANFTFLANDDRSGLAFTECRLDGGSWTVCTSPQNYSGIVTETLHTFEVRAVDVAGNVGTPTSFTWRVDRTLPGVSILSGPSGLVNVNSATLTFTGTDDLTPPGNLTFACRLDGSALATCTSPVTYSGLADGSHTFEVQATDQAGNQSVIATRTWTVDTTPPALSFTSQPPAQTPLTTATFAFTGTEALSPPINFSCNLDSAGFIGCTSPFTTTGLLDGGHVFEVRGTDQAGNSAIITATWTVDTTPPDTLIQSGPISPTSSITATLAFTGTDGGTGVSSFECSLNGSAFAGCASPQTYTGLSEGILTFTVRAIDVVGNIDPTPATFIWRIDLTPPDTTITGTPSDPSGSPDASFTFTGSDDQPGAVGFECSLDGGLFSACNSGTASYSGLSGGAHTFAVRTVDAAGNRDPSPASFSWTIDLTPPDTSLTATPPALDNGTVATFTFTGTDNLAAPGTLSFECRLDGGLWIGCTAPYSYTNLPEGSHTVEVRASDSVGNRDPSPASYTWIVDRSAPDAVLLSTPISPTAAISATFVFTGTDNRPEALTFECRLDGGAWTICTSPTIYPDVSDGLHTFEVRAIDGAGNVGLPSAWTWRVDRTPPATSILSGPLDPSDSPSATFTFAGTDNLTPPNLLLFECRLDGGTWTSCVSPRSYTGLSDGLHTFEVRAVDGVGNVDTSPAIYTWTVRLLVPGYSSTPFPGEPINIGNVVVGREGSANLLIRENGTATLQVSNPQISGANAAAFSLLAPPTFPINLEGGQSGTATLTVACRPSDIGSLSATLTLSTNDPLRPSVNYALQCVGINGSIYLPLMVKPAPPPPQPDLVVTALTITPQQPVYQAGEPVVVEVTITNQGQATAGPFWTDLYVNPTRIPLINDLWNQICGGRPCMGMVWAFTGELEPGQSVRFTSPPDAFTGQFSFWPGWLPSGTQALYVQADSVGSADYGAVIESNEANNIGFLPVTVVGRNP